MRGGTWKYATDGEGCMTTECVPGEDKLQLHACSTCHMCTNARATYIHVLVAVETATQRTHLPSISVAQDRPSMHRPLLWYT